MKYSRQLAELRAADAASFGGKSASLGELLAAGIEVPPGFAIRSDAELTEFERLIEVPDRDLLAWITGAADIPVVYDGPLFRRLRDFQLSGEGAR